jgi:ribosomal protein S18 acetylase RimI-like enzyme
VTITLRAATAADQQFVEALYFQTQRWIIEELYGWGGDEFESTRFNNFYCDFATQIILVDDEVAGFMTLLRFGRETNIQCLFLRPEYQNRGIGTQLLQGIIARAASNGTRLTIGTHHINPAKRLYERLGFEVVAETKYRVEFAYPPERRRGSA